MRILRLSRFDLAQSTQLVSDRIRFKLCLTPEHGPPSLSCPMTSPLPLIALQHSLPKIMSGADWSWVELNGVLEHLNVSCFSPKCSSGEFRGRQVNIFP